MIKHLKTAIYRQRCSICGTKGEVLCLDCMKNLQKIKYFNNTDSAYRFLYHYKQPLKQSFLRYKFHGTRRHKRAFSKLLDQENINFHDYDIITYVPISFLRYLERGFNQCKEVLHHSNIKTEKILIKKHGKRQSNLKGHLRKQNVFGSFKMCKDVQNKKILLFDDIYTTGSTINEAKRVLLLNGAKEVDVLILFKA